MTRPPRKHPARPIISAVKLIELAIDVDDHYERLDLLKAWREGDWETVRQFLATAEFHNDAAFNMLAPIPPHRRRLAERKRD